MGKYESVDFQKKELAKTELELKEAPKNYIKRRAGATGIGEDEISMPLSLQRFEIVGKRKANFALSIIDAFKNKLGNFLFCISL